MIQKPVIAIVRPATKESRPARKTFKRSQLFNVIAVLADKAPIHRVNVRRMSKALADKMVAKLYSEGAVRAYAVRG
jgi:hypothetical protein